MNGRVPIVLLIEQDGIQRGTVARILKAAGYCVIPTGRANEALETFATHHVDIALVVANTQSTTCSGPPLLDSLYTIAPRVPVVVLSGGVAGDRPAYEYPNVAVTLVKPVAPADVLASVDHVVRGAAFNWPPSEEDLADIQVVDTASWQTTQTKRPAAPATPTAPAAPGTPSVATVATMAAMPTREIVRAERARPVQLAPVPVHQVPGRVVPPRLIVRGLERRQWMDGRRLAPRTRRSLSVAATAFCGLALTTWLELRAPVRPGAPIDETAPVAANLPVLSASHYHVDLMPLVSARRVRPRATARIITSPAPPAPRDANRKVAIHDAAPPKLAPPNLAPRSGPSVETRTAAARAVPSPPVVPPARARATPSPVVDVASADAAEAKAARDAAMTAGNAPAPTAAAVAPADTPGPTRPVTRPATPAVALTLTRSGEDERDIYQVLQRYERAYERLDVKAAHAVWPSLDTRALSRAFDGLKAQALEFSHCRVAFELAEATAICGGRASYVPRVGRQAARTEPREWTFRLRKVDHDWLIAKAEVR
jgi:DNA-binding NarL/FixJ family response regulator